MRGDGRIYLRGKGPIKRFYMAIYVDTMVEGKIRRVQKVERTPFFVDTRLPEEQQRAIRNKAMKHLRMRRNATQSPTWVGADNEKATIGDHLAAYRTYAELMEFSNLSAVDSAIKRLVPSLGLIPAIMFRTTHADEFKLAMKQQGFAESSIDRWLSVLMAALHKAQENGALVSVPRVRLFNPENARQGFLEPALATAILNDITPPVMQDFYRMLYLKGVRPVSLEYMYWHDPDPRPKHSYSVVYRDEGLIRFPRGPRSKQKKARVIPIVGEISEIIERRWEARTEGDVISEFVFHVQGRHLQHTYRWTAWVKAREKHGRPDLIPYDLRRTFRRDSANAGVRQKTTMEIQGHLTVESSDRYDPQTLDDEREALLAVEKYRREQQAKGVKVVAMRGER